MTISRCEGVPGPRGNPSCEAVDRDRYGRTVTKCAVDGADLGRVMGRAGWARGIMSGTQAGIAGMTKTPPGPGKPAFEGADCMVNVVAALL